MIFDDKLEKRPLQKTFVVLFSLMDVLGDELVKSNMGECFRLIYQNAPFVDQKCIFHVISKQSIRNKMIPVNI